MKSLMKGAQLSHQFAMGQARVNAMRALTASNVRAFAGKSHFGCVIKN